MNLLPFIMYTFLITMTPGPTNIDILNTIRNKGLKGGIQYTYGAITAFVFLLIISTVVNIFLSEKMPSFLLFMKLIGSIYMLYLIYTLFRKHSENKVENDIGTFYLGFALQFLNPKVVTFTMTVIPTFVLVNQPSTLMISIYVIMTSIIALISFSFWIFFGTLLKTFIQKHEMIVNIPMALFLLYAAIIVWV